jgi:hypothetical protein
MRLRIAAVSGACCALLAGNSLCSAAEPTPAPAKSPSPTVSHPPAAIGGMIGGGQIFADGDYSNERLSNGDFGSRDSKPRFAFAANFRYAFNPSLRWQVSPGFFWVGYEHTSPLPFTDSNNPTDTTKEKVLTLVLPVSAQLQWTPHRGPWLYHVGAGPAVYRVWVENRRKVIKDPVTKVNHKGFYPGASGQVGVERFLKAQPNTAIEVSMAGHTALATRQEQFPSGFNASLWGFEFRVGANYYFDLGRFDKKKATPAK